MRESLGGFPHHVVRRGVRVGDSGAAVQEDAGAEGLGRLSEEPLVEPLWSCLPGSWWAEVVGWGLAGYGHVRQMTHASLGEVVECAAVRER